jgi:hypothetical protein
LEIHFIYYYWQNRLKKNQKGTRELMSGFQLHLKGMQNGGTEVFTMSLPWLELVFLVFLMPCHNLDGIFSIQTQILHCSMSFFFFPNKKDLFIFEHIFITKSWKGKKSLHLSFVSIIFSVYFCKY